MRSTFGRWLCRSELHHLAAEAGAGLLLLAVTQVHDGLRGLAGDAFGEIEMIDVEAVGFRMSQDQEAEDASRTGNRREHRGAKFPGTPRKGTTPLVGIAVGDQPSRREFQWGPDLYY